MALWTNASAVSLDWDAVPGATGYTVYRQGPGDAAFAPVMAQPQSGTTYVDSGLPSDAAYSYQVTATLPAGPSGPGNTVTARTLARFGVGNEMFWSYSQSPQEADAAPAEVAEAPVLGRAEPSQFGKDLDALIQRLSGPGRQLVTFELPLFPFDNAYGREQRRVARERHVVLVPKRFFAEVLAAPEATVDGIHLSAIGQRRMARMVWDLLGDQLSNGHSSTSRP